ncbi:hypothetical protein B0T17DRAFT_511026 [Bombardia bombarda]|uniref:Glucose-methanol-choline oxidoreductase N-terminal domain-containing protein n=1 Tax=Bombardia bombarda TaxID=252184 RepID=A0AA40BVK3_9PEZI|nr:hypothetical protein B0T17DRAFT_511026 [Bombardia bombarda]
MRINLRHFFIALFAFPATCTVAPESGQGHGGQQVETYDFIVIGGGTAGAAVATRISQGLKWANILLIEAGPAAPDEDRINIPGNRGSTIGTIYDWNFTTVPQTAAKNRGQRPEYDWEKLGNPGWNWPNMLTAMKRAETFTPSPSYGTTGVGSSGPIKTAINRYIPPQQGSWIPTMNSLNISHNLESLGGNPLGVMYQPSNIDSLPWNRSYSANGYLPLARSNLKILTNTRVAKVNLQRPSPGSSTYKAAGVTLQDGTVIAARAEVILSAGSIQSPGLLELSGIGQPSILSAANITTLISLPGVGENLQDHIRVMTSFQLAANYTSFDQLRINTTFRAAQLALRTANQLSMFDYTGSAYSFMTWAHVSASLSTTLSALARSLFSSSTTSSPPPAVKQKLAWLLSDPAVPQLEVIFSDGYTGVRGYPPTASPLFGNSYFTLISAIMHPFSRGSVHITSANIGTQPAINPNYLSNEYDVQAAIAAVRYARRIASTAPMRDIWAAEYEPGAGVDDSEAALRDYVLSTALSIYHPAGTCAMLPRKDGGVVSSGLVVYGTGNLRVVDASVLPVLVSGHLQTAVYGIAERAGEMVVEDWKGGGEAQGVVNRG